MRIQRVSEAASTTTGTCSDGSGDRRTRRDHRRGGVEAREAYQALYAVSLDQPDRSGGDDGRMSLLETMGARDSEFERAFDRVLLDSLLESLDERDQTIVRLYYQEGLTQREIGPGWACRRCTSPGCSGTPPRHWPTLRPRRTAWRRAPRPEDASRFLMAPSTWSRWPRRVAAVARRLRPPDPRLGERRARGGVAGHAVDRAAGERRGAAEVEAADRRSVGGQARERAEDDLIERVGAGADVAVDEVRVAALQVGGALDVTREDEVAEARREALDLGLEALDLAVGLVRPVGVLGTVGVGPGRVLPGGGARRDRRATAGRAAGTAARAGRRRPGRARRAPPARCRRRGPCPLRALPAPSTGSGPRAPSRA